LSFGVQECRQNVQNNVACRRKDTEGEDSEKKSLTESVVACNDRNGDVDPACHNEVDDRVFSNQKEDRPHFGSLMLAHSVDSGQLYFACA